MDVIQTGTNIATVKISELPKSTETAGRATLATNEQTNQSEALELTKVAEATQTALDAAQTANQSSQTALASAATANQAAQNADTARENIAGDLAQKSSMYTGAVMGKGKFLSTAEPLLLDGDMTLRVVFKTGSEVSTEHQITRTTYTNGGMNAAISSSILAIRVSGSRYTFHVLPSTLYELILIKSSDKGSCVLNAIPKSGAEPTEHGDTPIMLLLGASGNDKYRFRGVFISAQVFNFAFTDDDAAASWNGGHPELWRVPDAWRKEDSEQRVVVDLIPASLTPTVWKDISGQGNDIPYVPFDSNPAKCEMAYENVGFPDTIIGTGAPAVIPNFIGQRYVDTTNKAAYTAYGTSSASDWK